jgi:hypothetical protein
MGQAAPFLNKKISMIQHLVTEHGYTLELIRIESMRP